MYLCILEKCTFNGLHILYVVNRETGILYQIEDKLIVLLNLPTVKCFKKISLNMQYSIVEYGNVLCFLVSLSVCPCCLRCLHDCVTIVYVYNVYDIYCRCVPFTAGYAKIKTFFLNVFLGLQLKVLERNHLWPWSPSIKLFDETHI